MDTKIEQLRIGEVFVHSKDNIFYSMTRKKPIGPGAAAMGEIVEVEQKVDGQWHRRYYKIHGVAPHYERQAFVYNAIRIPDKAAAQYAVINGPIEVAQTKAAQAEEERIADLPLLELVREGHTKADDAVREGWDISDAIKRAYAIATQDIGPKNEWDLERALVDNRNSQKQALLLAFLLGKNPVYPHDCGNCDFLGHHQGYDLYFCHNITMGGSVIARYGYEGHQYVSTLITLFAYGRFESGAGQALEVACRKTVKKHFTFDYPKALATLKEAHETVLGLFDDEVKTFYDRHCKKMMGEALIGSDTDDVVKQLHVLYGVAELLNYFSHELGCVFKLSFHYPNIEIERIEDEGEF